MPAGNQGHPCLPAGLLTAKLVRQWRRCAGWCASFRKTIRGRILVAFLLMSAITASLGGYAIWGIQDAGILVRKTFDQSLMSINYARAAATDFAAMRAVFARRWIADDPDMRASLDEQIEGLAKTLRDDLKIAAQRSQSDACQAGRGQCAASRPTPGKAPASTCWTRRSSTPVGTCSTVTPRRSTSRSIC